MASVNVQTEPLTKAGFVALARRKLEASLADQNIRIAPRQVSSIANAIGSNLPVGGQGRYIVARVKDITLKMNEYRGNQPMLDRCDGAFAAYEIGKTWVQLHGRIPRSYSTDVAWLGAMAPYIGAVLAEPRAILTFSTYLPETDDINFSWALRIDECWEVYAHYDVTLPFTEGGFQLFARRTTDDVLESISKCAEFVPPVLSVPSVEIIEYGHDDVPTKLQHLRPKLPALTVANMLVEEPICIKSQCLTQQQDGRWLFTVPIALQYSVQSTPFCQAFLTALLSAAPQTSQEMAAVFRADLNSLPARQPQ